MSNVETLARIRAKAKQLDQKLAEVNLLIEGREKALNDTGIGVEAVVLLGSETNTFHTFSKGRNEDDEKRPAIWVTYFGFGKRTGKWGFFVHRKKFAAHDGQSHRSLESELHFDDMVDEHPPIDLRSASRDLRIQAMEAYGALLEAIDEAARELLQKPVVDDSTKMEGESK